jgi:hypothetical protein
MPLVRTALIATAACLIGAAAYAQPATTDQAPPAGGQMAPDNSAPAAPADQSAPATSTDMSASPAQTGAAANTSATVGPNGTQVIASQPVPDTPANRAAFGQPLSHAGKHTKPAGN